MVFVLCFENFRDEAGGEAGGAEEAGGVSARREIRVGEEAAGGQEEQKEAEEAWADAVRRAEAVRDVQGGLRGRRGRDHPLAGGCQSSSVLFGYVVRRPCLLVAIIRWYS